MVKPHSFIPILFAVLACIIQDDFASAETDEEKFHQPFVTIYNDKEARSVLMGKQFTFPLLQTLMEGGIKCLSSKRQHGPLR